MRSERKDCVGERQTCKESGWEGALEPDYAPPSVQRGSRARWCSRRSCSSSTPVCVDWVERFGEDKIKSDVGDYSWCPPRKKTSQHETRPPSLPPTRTLQSRPCTLRPCASRGMSCRACRAPPEWVVTCFGSFHTKRKRVKGSC